MGKHSNAIKKMGIAVLLISLAAAFAFGLLYGSNVKVSSGYSHIPSSYKFEYNWSICATIGVSGTLFSFIFFALYHVTAAIEETKQDINKYVDRILESKEKISE